MPSKSSGVRILNPAPDGSRYTSQKNALRLVRNGLSVWANPEKTAIEHLSSEFLRQVNSAMAKDRLEESIVSDRGGVIWWNGSDHRPHACHIPGENVMFPRPDRMMPYIRAMEAAHESEIARAKK